MVRAIANVGPCDGWTGVAYNDMRTKKIDEEKERIDRALFVPHGRSMDAPSSPMDGVMGRKEASSTSLSLALLAPTSCVP